MPPINLISGGILDPWVPEQSSTALPLQDQPLPPLPRQQDSAFTPLESAALSHAETLAKAENSHDGHLLPYTDARFAGTHNSYAGGDRGSIIDQLEHGVRAIEFDVHDNDFDHSGYRLGHDHPGHDVSHDGGNPDGDALVDWLDAISEWSSSNPDHAPITLYLDLKDNLDDNPNYTAGDLGRLGSVLKQRLGNKLYLANESTDSLPTVAALRGKVLTVLSGDETSRLAYRRDSGENPAVAINAKGHVVEVHDSGSGDLWLWAGQMQDDGTVHWHRHTRYDTGDDPAVAINNDGLVVEAHEDPDSGDNKLWYRVGQLNDKFEIDWFHDRGLQFPKADKGVNPSLRFNSGDGETIREVHDSQKNGDNFYWNGKFDHNTKRITWTREPGDNGRTSDAVFDTGRDEASGRTIEVTQGAIGPYGADTLRYRTNGGDDWAPIRYDQIMFVESQYDGDPRLEADKLWFSGACAEENSGIEWAERQQSNGRVSRLWDYEGDLASGPQVNILATDMLMPNYNTIQ